MHSLTALDLLAIWEHGQAQHPIRRALSILACALPDIAPDALECLSIGSRDARLFAVREDLFGPLLRCMVECSACQERLEFSFDIAARGLVERDEAIRAVSQASYLRRVGEYELEFRLPASRDLTAIVMCSDADTAGRRLAQRCIALNQHFN
jgi:hypothetical protein